MSQDKKEQSRLQKKLLNEVKNDLKGKKHAEPRRYRENVAYFQRMAIIS